MKTEWIDVEQLRKALNILKPTGTLFELRILFPQKKNLSGYFSDIETAIAALQGINLRHANVFFTLNNIDPECYGRIQHDILTVPEGTTGDGDILAYEWLLVDLDPKRKSGTSSTNEQLEAAHSLARRIFAFLQRQGFEEPVVAMSGNGYHMLYKIGMSNAPENSQLVQDVLNALDMLFSDEKVEIDTGNFNASRICKMYGTLAQKGAGTEERPHRMSYIVSAPAEIRQTSKVYLQKIADMLPKTDTPQEYNHYQPTEFDVRQWLGKHGIRYQEKKGKGDYTKLVLDECPFDSSHKAPDSMITVGNNGAIGFKCFHNSCQGRAWKDVRLMFEPDAYDRKEQNDVDGPRLEKGWEQHKKYNRDREIHYDEADEDLGPDFYTPSQVFEMPDEVADYIPSGIIDIDHKIGGLKKGYLSLMTGLRGGSKSTLLTTFVLSAVNAGHNVLVYSGELQPKTYMKWMNLQAAGKDHTWPLDKIDRAFYVKSEDQKKIAEWLDPHLLLYNNDYGNNYSKILARIRRQIEQQKTDLIVLDNLMALDIRDLAPDKFDAQKVFVQQLSSLAKRTRTHIIFVAHPRKAMGFLRLDDVSGSADLANLVDNAFIVHRNNEDFRRLSKDMFKWKDDNEAYSGTNVIEIAKDRDMGTQDVFIPLWYEPETKRLKNEASEMIHYGWDTSDDFVSVDSNDGYYVPF